MNQDNNESKNNISSENNEKTNDLKESKDNSDTSPQNPNDVKKPQNSQNIPPVNNQHSGNNYGGQQYYPPRQGNVYYPPQGNYPPHPNANNNKQTVPMDNKNYGNPQGNKNQQPVNSTNAVPPNSANRPLNSPPQNPGTNYQQNFSQPFQPPGQTNYNNQNWNIPSPYANTFVPRFKTENYLALINLSKKTKTTVMAVMTLIFGVLFFELLFMQGIFSTSHGGGGIGLSVPIVVIVFYVIAFIFMGTNFESVKKSSLLLLIPIFILSAFFVIYDSGYAKSLNFFALAALIPLQLTSMYKKAEEPIFGKNNIINTLKAWFSDTFGNLDMPFKTLFGKKNKEKKSSHGFAYACLGLLIALPVALILIALFSQADENFEKVFKELANFLRIDIGNFIIDLMFGLPIGLYFISLFMSQKAIKPKVYKEKYIEGSVNNIAVTTFLAVITVVELIFVVVQAVYYLPALYQNTHGGSFAEYARKGFFDLAAVTGILFAVIFVVYLIAKRNNKGKLPLSSRCLISLMSLCDVIIIISALYRMNCYVLQFGLTAKRISVAWFIILLALVLLLINIKIWYTEFKLMTFSAGAVFVMIICLNLINPNVYSAQYNVSRYLNGTLSQVDLKYLEDMGPSAVPQIDRLMGTEIEEDAKICMNQIYENEGQSYLGRFTLPYYEAEKIYAKYDNLSSNRMTKEYRDKYYYDYENHLDYRD